MSHFVFVDPNDVALAVMSRAVILGHRVSVVQPLDFRWYSKTKESVDILRHARRILPLVSCSDAEALQTCFESIQAHDPIDAIINMVDATIETTAMVCSKIGITFTKYEGVRCARDKLTDRQTLAAKGFKIPKFRFALDVPSALVAASECGFPAIMKPISGFASVVTFRVNDLNEAEMAALEILRCPDIMPKPAQAILARGILIEEYLPGTLVSAEVALLNDEFAGLMITGRATNQDNECCGMGSILPADLSADQEVACYSYAKDVCAALELDFGVFDLEIMLTGNGPVLLEANPRMMGGAMPIAYRHATGVPFEDIVLDVYSSRSLPQHQHRAIRYAVIRKIMPLRQATLPAHLDLDDIILDYRCSHFSNYLISSARLVHPGDILGRFIVCGVSLQAALQRANELLDKVEGRLELQLIRPETNQMSNH